VPHAACCRTIFRWITVKNLNTMQFDENLRGDTPMGLLRGIKHGTESYHVLFKRLCRSVCAVCFVTDTAVQVSMCCLLCYRHSCAGQYVLSALLQTQLCRSVCAVCFITNIAVQVSMCCLLCYRHSCAGQYVLSALLQTQLCRSWHHLLVQNSVEICWCCECGNETLGSVRHSQSVNISAWWGQQWQLMKCSKLSQSGYSFAQKQFIACTYSWVVWLCKLWWPADTIVENEEWLLHEVTLQLLFCFQSTVFPGP